MLINVHNLLINYLNLIKEVIKKQLSFYEDDLKNTKGNNNAQIFIYVSVDFIKKFQKLLTKLLQLQEQKKSIFVCLKIS